MRWRRDNGTEATRPGLIRTARIDRRIDQLVSRANPGDIAVIDVTDLDRGTADQLLAAGVSAVVNASTSSSGRYPVNGARALLDAGVVLVDDVGGEVFSRVRDGDTVRLDGATVYAAGEPVVDGRLQSDDSVRASNEQARTDFRERLGALVADAGRRLADDTDGLLEGDTFPSLVTDLSDRVVVVVTSGAEPDELALGRALRRGRDALVVAVGAGADLAREARLHPDLIVVGRGVAPRDGYAKAGEVLVLDNADADGPVPAGIPRAHARSLGSAEDTAVVLAHARGAALVVTLGLDESLAGLLDRSATAGSAPLLSRLRSSGRQVSGAGAAILHGRVRRPRRARAVPVLGLVIALLAGAGIGAAVLRDDDAAGPATGAADTPAARSDAAFTRTVAPTLVADRLAGHVATVIALPGVSASQVRVVSEGLGAAGAAVSAPVTLGADYLDARSTRVLRDLAVQLAPGDLRRQLEAQPASAPPAAALDAVLAAVLARKQVAAVGSADPAAANVLTGLARLGGITAPPTGFSPGDLAVVVVPANANPEVAARTVALTRALSAKARAVTVVAASGATSGASRGVVGALRAENRPKNVSTVDDGVTGLGRVSAVLSLALILAGHTGGDFGAAGDADAPVPIAAAAKARARTAPAGDGAASP